MKKLIILFVLALFVSIGTVFACDDCISTGDADNNIIDIAADGFIELALGSQDNDPRCTLCRGSGRCPTCAGNGYVTDNGIRKTCEGSCRITRGGTGSCGRCDGTGRRR